MEPDNKVYKLSEQARSAITTCFLKSLAQETDLQSLLEDLDFLVLSEANDLGVLNPPGNIVFGTPEEIEEKLQDADV